MAPGKPTYVDWDRDTLFVKNLITLDALCGPWQEGATHSQSDFEVAWQSQVQRMIVSLGASWIDDDARHRQFENLWRLKSLVVETQVGLRWSELERIWRDHLDREERAPPTIKYRKHEELREMYHTLVSNDVQGRVASLF